MDSYSQQPSQPTPLASQGTTLQGQVPQPPQPQPPQPENWVLIIVIVIIVAIISSAAAYFVVSSQTQTQSQLSKISPSLSPTLLPSEVLTKEGDPTANWKTYISLNRKYQFQYPNDMSIAEEKQLRADLFENYTYIKKGDQTLSTIVFFASSNTTYPTLDDFAKGERLQRDDLPNQTKDTISIANTTAYKFKLNAYGNPGPVVIVKLNNQYIQFINQGFQNFDQILSTFKFTK